MGASVYCKLCTTPRAFHHVYFPLCFMGVTNSYYYYDDDDIKSFSRVGILDLQFGSTADMLVCKSQYTNCLLSKHLSFLVLEHWRMLINYKNFPNTHNSSGDFLIKYLCHGLQKIWININRCEFLAENEHLNFCCVLKQWERKVLITFCLQ